MTDRERSNPDAQPTAFANDLAGFQGGRIRFASVRVEDGRQQFGSLYSVDPDADAAINRGFRIRLMHPHAPEVSQTASVRYAVPANEAQRGPIRPSTIALRRTDTEVGEGRQLVEARTNQRDESITHVSRGGATAIVLNDAQVKAVYDAACASMHSRASISKDDTDLLAKHTRYHNARMEIVLRGELFAGHPLQRSLIGE